MELVRGVEADGACMLGVATEVSPEGGAGGGHGAEGGGPEEHRGGRPGGPVGQLGVGEPAPEGGQGGHQTEGEPPERLARAKAQFGAASGP
ncbi:MAG: hypothetical protein MUF64_28015, partial [Polyangiaceae bacterium]|nr:hypothetical protein [Polyangiaceae bacterium]